MDCIDWQSRASAVRWKICPFVDGCFVESRAHDSFENLNPATESSLCTVATGCASDVDAAVKVARQRFEDGSWSRKSPAARAEVLRRLAHLIKEDREHIALLDTLEMGKPISAALYDVEHHAPSFFNSNADVLTQLFGRAAPLTGDLLTLSLYEPKGVVGAISPWNFPVVNAAIKVSAALAAGNCIVLKPSEIASSSALRLAELAISAGVPEGVFNVVPGLGSSAGAALAAHPEVDFLTFTGSTTTGRRIMEISGRSNGRPLMLECGGKSPQIVFDDIADLDAVAKLVVRNAFWNQGQVCSARTRLVVQSGVKEPLLERILLHAGNYQPQNPLDEKTVFGPLASPGQRDRVLQYVIEGSRSGAKAILRGDIQESKGCYVAPTIFDQVSADMSIARDEIFGPVLCIQEFTDDSEALSLANETDYGLAATLWTNDLARALHFAREIRAGDVSICSSGKEQSGPFPFMGCDPQKASGFGCEVGIEGLKSYSNLKLIRISGA